MPTDARALSTKPLVAPAPLPYVSRRALRRVKNPLPAPTCCPYCEGPVALVSNAEVYGREYGAWPYLYLCRACDAYVGLHPDTDIPLGKLADRELREARKESKGVFQSLSARQGWSRTEAYKWLADRMGIPVGECHFGWFDLERCEQAGRTMEIAWMKGEAVEGLSR